MITVKGIRKKFGPIHALNSVDLTVESGSLVAIAGPNGSGKSTLIKSILGLVKTDAGEMFIDGVKLNGQPEYRRGLGYMPQQGQFPENLRVKEVFQLVKSVRDRRNHLDEELVDAFDLNLEWNKRIRTLSGGTRQKVNAAIAFLFSSPLIILDEPTASLDPVSSGILKRKIRQRRDAGCSIIMTTHVLSDIEELADRFVFLCEGKVVYSGTISALRTQTGQHKLEDAFACLIKDNGA